jgi:signal-transduction protein with cAMP-binding, CBS, and nucleotidyltransferase domain
MDITKFMEKMKLLKKLENKNLDDFSKQLYIEDYKKRNEPVSYGLHVENAGLFTDWDFTL